MLGLSETIYQLAMAYSVRWYVHALRIGGGLEEGIRFLV